MSEHELIARALVKKPGIEPLCAFCVGASARLSETKVDRLR
ncbi:hypothetical protein [Mesorhizobium sp.]|nr:hypothetical protein [Mesorhizobium sp.]